MDGQGNRGDARNIAWQAAELAQPLDGLLLRLRRQPPGVVVTCARGSSAHAATFAKHLIERYLGLPVAEAAPSIASVYQRHLHLCGQLVLAISQSGNSDDLIVFASHARGAGALTVAVTNDPASPLAAACEFILPIAAGPERSVAATDLVKAGVRVALGHSMATYAQTRAALAEGLTGFTHLFNAMRQLGARDPGPIAAALECSGAWFGMIVDGVHVDPAMLRLALRGSAHPMLITDAMPPVGGSRRTFRLFRRDIEARGEDCVAEDGTLAGTAPRFAIVFAYWVCPSHRR